MPANTSSQGGPRPAAFVLAEPWLYPLLACLVLAFLFAIHPINDSDLGLHLKGGQWILENHRFPSTDTYTYTLADRSYLDIHWFYQVVLYFLYRLGGYSLLTLFHALLIAATGFLAFKRLRFTGASYWICSVLLLTTLLACEIRFRVRPEIASWLLLSLTLWVLELRNTQNRDLLWLLPILQLVWVNVEGLFILGWVVMGLYVVSGLSSPRGLDKKLLRYSLIAAGVCILNPNFFRGMAYPVSNFITLTNPVMHDSLKELQSPWFATPSLLFAPTLYLLLYKLFSFFLFGLMTATFHRRTLRDWLMALVFFALSASAFRNIPLFLVACIPLAAPCWKDLEWAWLRKAQAAFLSRPMAAGLFVLLVLGISLRVVTGAYYVSDRRTDRFGLGLDNLAQPVRASEFLVEKHLDGKILNQLDDGGWLDWQGPQKTFIDGRFEVSGADFYYQYLAAATPGGLAALAGKYQADILFFSSHNASWTGQLQSMPDWRPVYLDPCTVVYLRKGYRDEIPSLDSSRVLSQAGISPSIINDAEALLQAPPPPASLLDGFLKPVVFPDDLSNLGIFFGTSGHPQEAEACFLEAIRRSQGRYYDFYYNLGLLYAQEGQRTEWGLCLSQVLKRDPPAALARRLQEI